MQIFPIPAFRDNYIWALCAQGHCIVVDPGEAAPVQNFLAAQNLRLATILVTHRHNDHIGGIEALRETWPVPVFGPASISQVTHPVSEGDLISLLGISGSAKIMAVPGHTEEHIAYLIEQLGDSHLFCGDTLFAAGCGRILGTSSAEEFHATLQRLAALAPDTQIHCTHEYTLSNLRFALNVEPHNTALIDRQAQCASLRELGLPTLPSRLADELATNPFLRTHIATVRAAAMQHAQRELESEASVFAALRAWKDIF